MLLTVRIFPKFKIALVFPGEGSGYFERVSTIFFRSELVLRKFGRVACLLARDFSALAMAASASVRFSGVTLSKVMYVSG